MLNTPCSKAIVAALLLAIGAAAGWAQDRPVNLYETSPLNVRGGLDTGVPYGNRKLTDTTVILTLPTFSLMQSSPRSDFSVFYKPEFEIFTSYRHLNSWDHNAGLRWDAAISPRWSFNASDRFLSTHDDGRQMESTFLLPRGPYRENGFYSSLNYDLTTQTRLKFRYENIFVDYRAENMPSPLFFSRFANSTGLTLEHRFSPKTKVSGSYSYLQAISLDDVDYLGNPILPFEPTHSASLTVSFNPAKTLLLEFTGGYVRNPTNSYILGGLIEKHFRKVVAGAGFSRYLTFLGSPTAASIGAGLDLATARVLPPNSISNTASIRVAGYFTDHWGLELRALASETTGLRNRNLRTAMGGIRLNYKVSDRIVFFASTDLYRQNANPILAVPISRGRYYGGIEFTFSPTPEEVARRRDQAHNRGQAANQTPEIGKKEN